MKRIFSQTLFIIFLILLLILCMTLCTSGQTDSYSIKSAKGLVHQAVILVNALEDFSKDMGRYPSTEEGLQILVSPPSNHVAQWKGPYVTKIFLTSYFRGDINKDVWGTRYVYLCPAQYGTEPYDLFSFGKNMMNDFGQKDDITNWKELDREYYPDQGIRDDFLSLGLLSLIIFVFIITVTLYFTKH